MKRVCVIIYSYYPHHAHARRDIETLVANDYQVDVICLKDEGEKKYERISGVNVYRLNVNRSRGGVFRYMFQYLSFTLTVFWKLTWLSLKRRYQVVEIDSPPDFIVFTTLIPKLLGSKVILYIFDHIPETFRGQYSLSANNLIVRFLRIIEKASALWANHIITVNKLCRKLIEDEGIQESKLSVVLNVPNDDVYSNIIPSRKGASEFRVITHGSILYRYGIQTLIKAVPLLIKEIPDISVEIIGDGEYRKHLQRLSESLHVEDYIHFTGLIPYEQLPPRIAAADVGVICVLASNKTMLPNKLFEYIASGKPIITSRVQAISAYFDNNSLMFYEPENEYDLSKCIVELYQNPKKRETLAKASLVNHDKYRWAVMKKEYLQVYERLTS